MTQKKEEKNEEKKDENTTEVNVSLGQKEDNDEEIVVGVYPLRWGILFISCVVIFMRGFNQSAYGPINSVFVKYLQVEPWQSDWIVLTQSVVFLSMALPLSWITSRIGFRYSYILLCATMALGFGLTCVGSSFRTGFPAVILGQFTIGLSNIISWAIPPSTAAIWFPSREVATAVAILVVARGIGESIGSVVTPLIVTTGLTNDMIGYRLMCLFIAATSIAVLLTISVILFVKDEPPLPPSESRAKAIREKKRKGNMQHQDFVDALKQYRDIIKELFVDPYYIVVWILFGVANPVLRNYSVLLSSELHTNFPNDEGLNLKAGYMLMGSWIVYIVGGFMAGPIITKTKKYRYMVIFSVGFECISTMLVMIGMQVNQIMFVYVGVIALGFFMGMANTSLFEIVLEVTYPKPPMLVTMVNITGLGIWRLIYPIIGRYLLMYVNATASCSFPFAVLLAATILIAIVKTPTKRLDAEVTETIKLLDDDRVVEE